MKKKLLILLAISTLFLTGCGDALYEMTDEEQDLIVTYAARTISKYNIYQKDGVTGFDSKSIKALKEKKNVQEKEETSEAVENTESTANGTKPDANVENTEKETSKYESIRLAELIQNSSVTVAYEGNYLADSFVEEGIFALDAEKNKTFLVVEISLTNQSTEVQKVDMPSKDQTFYVEVGSKVKAKTTILPQDFTTYAEEIPAGETVKTVMLFEISKENAESLKEPVLLVKKGNDTRQIVLK